MKRTLSLCIISVFLLAVAGCGAQGDTASSNNETAATTTVTTTIANEITTATTSTTTSATTKTIAEDKIELEEYDESKNDSYSLLAIDFSVPYYWSLDDSAEQENVLRFFNKPQDSDLAILTIMYANGKGSNANFEKSKDNLQRSLIDKQTVLTNITNENQFDGELNAGLPYRCFTFQGDDKNNNAYQEYVTMTYDESAEKLYYVILLQPLTSKYGYFTDYASIIDGIKLQQAAEVSIDNVRISQDSQGRKIVIVDMTYTNTSGSNQTFFTNYDCRAYQNKVELDSALFIDGIDYSSLSKSVQPGGSLSLSEAFILNDTSEITLEITNLLGTKTILSEKYTIN